MAKKLASGDLQNVTRRKSIRVRFRLSPEDAKTVREAEKVSPEHAAKVLLRLLYQETH